MKATGIVRKLDELGRIVLPMELRRTLNIESRDEVEIYVEGDNIILKKYAPNEGCIFCEQTENLVTFYDKKLCRTCADTIIANNNK